jgi:hypothetical protein
MSEVQDLYRLNRKLSDLLDGVAYGLKGPTRDGLLHDWSDLPAVATRIRTERDLLHAQVERLIAERDALRAQIKRIFERQNGIKKGPHPSRGRA